MTDIEISNKWNLPIQTIQKWKKYDNKNWRQKIYNLLKEKKFEKYPEIDNLEDRHYLQKQLEYDDKLINSIYWRAGALSVFNESVDWGFSEEIFRNIINDDKFLQEDYFSMLALKHNSKIAIKIRELENLEN